MAETPSVGPRGAWIGLALLLCAGALAGWWLPREGIDWQPARAGAQPWRAFTAVFVHYSPLHLLANLAGGALVAALGHVARMPGHGTVAWLAAWPLTQWGLLAQPQLLHYGGLSGVWHAGVAVAAVHLLAAGPTRARIVGAAMLGGLLLKVLGEAPWAAPLRHSSSLDIAIAPMAHATGLVAGLLCALVGEGWARRRGHRRP